MASAIDSPSLQVLESAVRQYVESENQRRKSGPLQPHPYIYASSRRKCLRRSVYECTQPDLMPEFDTDTKARFIRGEQREVDIRLELTRAGQLSNPRYDFVGVQEPVKIHDRNGRLIISGKIDGFIRWEGGESWPVEIKAWSARIVDRIQSFADVYNNPWTWSGAHQLLSYLYAKAVPFGVLALDRSGLPKLIGVSLEENLTQMESFLNDAERCVDYIEAEDLPPHIQDAAECKRCPFYGSSCNPPLLSGEGVHVLTDPEIEAMLDRREELKAAALEYDSLDEDVKKKLRGVESGVAGKWMITGRWGKHGSNPKGRFSLEFTKF